jgi:hypothetical protein
MAELNGAVADVSEAFRFDTDKGNGGGAVNNGSWESSAVDCELRVDRVLDLTGLWLVVAGDISVGVGVDAFDGSRCAETASDDAERRRLWVGVAEESFA